MNCSKKSHRHQFGILGGALALAAIAAAATFSGAQAQSGGPDVFRVEEDWELIVGDADASINAPQVTCTISPWDMDYGYCAFDLNYKTQPDYSAGGLQIHTWDPQDPIEYANSTRTGVMSSSNETVTWTQSMTLDPNGNSGTGSLAFQVIAGKSNTWSTFGGTKGGNNGHLLITVGTGLNNLNTYSPDVSINNSGVSYASNLVVSLTLKAVRKYNAAGAQISEDTTPRIVHPQQ